MDVEKAISSIPCEPSWLFRLIWSSCIHERFVQGLSEMQADMQQLRGALESNNKKAVRSVGTEG